MRPLMISLVIAAALSLPLAALATDAPPPAVVSACQAEAAQLGKDAFVAKYGPTEPFGHCFAAHMPATTTTTTPTTTATTTTSTTTTTTSTPAPPNADVIRSIALKLCAAAAKSHEKEALGKCLKAALPRARQIVAGATTRRP